MKLKQEMEQKKNITNNNSKEDRYLGVAIHSQVRKIKQEMERIKHPSLEQPEIRPVLWEITRQKRSRSPLGLAERERPISVAN
ncbi:unnamed protein product [Ilex paraguariensis]|uniref:Uncharacterized protein n=1 Tax=Ilex paraguariensis TaxID=185542 RepID=A0ABC8R831_9AQUA